MMLGGAGGGEASEVLSLLEGCGPGSMAHMHALYSTVREPWLARGLVAYHTRTGSARALELLARAPDHHGKHLLDALAERLRAPERTSRGAALHTLAQLAARRPAWLHRLAGHALLREVLRVLRTDCDAVPLLNALLALVTLLPAAPSLVAQHLSELTEAFARLAAWGGAAPPGRREHLQLGLYALFHGLYATHPCTLLDFLRHEYGRERDGAVFRHTVLPMLESVRLHPDLVTGSRQLELSGAARPPQSSSLDHRDMLADCRRPSLEPPAARDADDAPAPVAPADDEPAAAPGSGAHAARGCAALRPGAETWFPLGERCGADSAPHTPLPAGDAAGGSPPEAAVEATPENTPVKEPRATFSFPTETGSARAIGRHSQPPSPLRKETSPLALGADAHGSGRLMRVVLDRAQPDAAPGARRARGSVPNSPVPMGGAPPAAAEWPIARPEPSRPDGRGPPPPTEPLNVEDREVLELTARSARGAAATATAPERLTSACANEWGGGVAEEEAGCRVRAHGLHMPRGCVLEAARGVASRLRLYSGGTSGGERGGGAGCALSRASSCPSLREHAPRTHSVSSQTVDAWPAPYEPLLADFYHKLADAPPLRSSPAATAGEPSERLDAYLARMYGGAAPAPPAAGPQQELAEQLALTHAQLMYERWRREAHSERNRRLLGRCRQARATDQQNAALRDRLRGLQRDYDELALRLTARADHACSQPPEGERLARLEAELGAERSARARAEAALRDANARRADDAAEMQRLRADAFELTRRLETAARAAAAGERRADHVRRLRRELLILGEREARLAEAAAHGARGSVAAAARLARHYRDEVAAAKAEAGLAAARAEAAVARDAELESALAAKESAAAALRQQARLAAEEHAARLSAVQDKYKALMHVLRRMESHRLELLAGGCGGGGAASGGGASPQSSPLSASLASAEGPLAARLALSEVSRVRHLLEDEPGPAPAADVR